MVGKLWEYMRTQCVCLAGHKWLKDEYKDPDVLPKVNKANMAGIMEAINEYLRSCHSIMRVHLAYIIT